MTPDPPEALRLNPNVDPARAAAILRPKFSPVTLLLEAARRIRKGPARLKNLPALELIWLPQYLAHGPKGPAAGGLLINARSGLAAPFKAPPEDAWRDDEPADPVKPNPVAIAGASLRGELDLPFSKTEAECRAIAESRLRAAIRNSAEAGGRIAEMRLTAVRHPIWVYYWERRPGIIDFRALDAFSGARVGGAIRRVVIEGLIEVNRRPRGASGSAESSHS